MIFFYWMLILSDRMMVFLFSILSLTGMKFKSFRLWHEWRLITVINILNESQSHLPIRMKELSFSCNTNKIKWKTENTVLKYHTVGTVLKSNWKIVERGTINTFSWLGAETSIRNCEIKLVLWNQASPLIESMSL